MRSSSSSSLLDLAHDLPTSREDILALRKAREPRLLSFTAYLEFLASFTPPSNIELRDRKGPAGIQPFKL